MVKELVSFMFWRRLRRFLVGRRERMDGVEMLRCWCCGCDSHCILRVGVFVFSLGLLGCDVVV